MKHHMPTFAAVMLKDANQHLRDASKAARQGGNQCWAALAAYGRAERSLGVGIGYSINSPVKRGRQTQKRADAIRQVVANCFTRRPR